MSHHLRKTSKLATMDAARELYFIVVALAILKSLELSFLELPSHNVALYDWFFLLRSEPSLTGIAVEFAFLFTVLRYSHGVSHLLAFEKHCVESSGLPSSFRILMLFVFLSALGILFFLMAYNIRDFPAFVFWMSVMFGLDFTYIAFSKVVRAPLLRFMLWFPGRVVLRWRRFLEEREKNKAGATNNGTSPPSSTDDQKIESEWINTTPGYAADAALQWMLSDSLIVIFSLLLLKYGATYAHRQLLFAGVICLAGVLDYWFNLRFYFGGWRDRLKKKIVFVCSPYTGGVENPTESDYRKNICQAQAYCREVMKEGDIPFASHCFYPYFLNYGEKKEAILARYCSLAFLRACDAIYLYLPHKPRFNLPLLKWIEGPDMKALNSSPGMKEKLIAARRLGLRIKFRNDKVSVQPKDCWKPNATGCSRESVNQDELERMKRVYVCTPLRGVGWKAMSEAEKRGRLAKNVRLAFWESFRLVNEGNGSIAPFAPQAFYPYFVPVLGSENKWERWFERSLEVLKICDAIYVYTESGLANYKELSKGMTHLIELAEELGMEIQYRQLSTKVPSVFDPALPNLENLKEAVRGLPDSGAPLAQLQSVPTQGMASATTEPGAASAAEPTASGKIQVYFAGPLFTQGEWQWNIRLKDELERLGMEVILPQNEAYPMLKNERAFDPGALFRANTAGIERADLLLAILDQADPDSGTCWECGYAYKLGCPVLGLRTDIRTTGDAPGASVNLMLPQSCKEFLQVPLDKREDVPWVAALVLEAIKRIMKPAS